MKKCGIIVDFIQIYKNAEDGVRTCSWKNIKDGIMTDGNGGN